MQRIYKYPLDVKDEQFIEMHATAAILTVQVQRGIPCLWAKVNPIQLKTARRIVTVGTGHPMPDEEDLAYIGTYQLEDGGLVFHVFTDRNYI